MLSSHVLISPISLETNKNNHLMCPKLSGGDFMLLFRGVKNKDNHDVQGKVINWG